jgi:Ca2+-binding EF-hand superfamily protein
MLESDLIKFLRMNIRKEVGREGIEMIIRRMDLDGDGMVSFEDFENFVLGFQSSKSKLMKKSGSVP